VGNNRKVTYIFHFIMFSLVCYFDQAIRDTKGIPVQNSSNLNRSHLVGIIQQNSLSKEKKALISKHFFTNKMAIRITTKRLLNELHDCYHSETIF